MKKMILLAASVFSFSVFAADKYSIDPAHASVVFKINHMGFSNVYGMFGDISGDFTVDEKDISKSSMNVTIKTDSVNTQNAKRDDHLKKADFFDAKQFPTITFKSTSFKKKSDKVYEVTGALTMHGKSQTITFDLHRNRTGEDPMKKTKTGADATFSVKRSAFGMGFMAGENKLGDDVELMISVEGAKI